LRTLRSANNGDKDALQLILEKGFGRIDVRRRQLMSNFTPAAQATDTEALEAMIEAKQQTKPNLPPSKFFNYWDLDKLKRLLKSQEEQQNRTKNVMGWRSKIRNVDPDVDIPKTNIWGKPPAKRAKWWKRAAEKMLPPLSHGEWELLGRLSHGAQKEAEWAVPTRRTKGATMLTDPEEVSPSAWDWEPYANHPTSTVEKPKSLLQQRRTGQLDHGPYSPGDRTRAVTPRFYRRAYRRIWATVPKMNQNPETRKYNFTWGPVSTSKLPPATSQQLAVFEGVNEKGHKLGNPK
jgi:hypothetical protein